MGRGDVDDAPPIALPHAGQRPARGVKGRAEVDGDHGIPTVDWKRLNGRHMLNAGVVHQDVHAPEVALGAADEVFDLLGLAHVGSVMQRLYPSRGHRLDGRLGRLGVAEAVEHQVCTLAGQALGDAQADTAGRAGHQSYFSVDRHLNILQALCQPC